MPTKLCSFSYQDTWQPIRLLQKENGVIDDVNDL